MQRSIVFGRLSTVAAFSLPLLLLTPVCLPAQVFTVEPAHVEKHYTSFPPTRVSLPAEPLNVAGREQLIRFMQSEQGFAMRPLPVGTLVLHANGHMEPSGEKYVDELHEKGIAAKPGDRVVVTDISIRDNKVILDLNNGPYHKHRFLRHLSIGMDPYASNPLVTDGAPPTGSRVTLVFEGRIPDLSGEQLEALLKPMIDFGVKSPAEAYAESLPDFLRKAIEQHRVLIGMDRDMVRYAKGEPIRKVREQKNGQAFEIWMYGETPQPVEFVRFIGNFVVRVEIAKVGEPLLVRTANEMGDYWGTAPAAVATNQHEVVLGDRTAASVSEEDATKRPPTLRDPGEKLPADSSRNTQATAPVNFPKDMQRPGDPGYTPPSQGQPGTAPQPASGAGSPQQPNPLDSAPQQSSSGNGQPTGSSPGPQH